MILATINKEIEDFKSKLVQIVPGLTFNQWDNIQKIYFYYSSQYETGMIDDEGDRKYFSNISKNPCKVFSKAVDFDTKNIRMLTVGGGDPLKTWFMERDVKYWMRDKQFGKTLNRLFKELPIFGTVVLKIVEGTPYFVDLRNFIVEQAADSLEEMNYITEIHNLTVGEFRKRAKLMKWNQTDVDEVISLFYQMKGCSHIKLYERYGNTPMQQEDGSMTYDYRRVFIADVGNDTYDDRGTLTMQHPGIELSSEEWEGNPYWEFHADKMPGRWQGIGVVETLFEPQIAENQLANLQSKISFFLALLVFQTRDPSGGNRNLISQSKNGDILATDSDISQIGITDRNGAFFNELRNRWLRNRDELTFSYDVVQGERLPAGTPLGSAQIAVTQTLSYFEQIQEDIALDVKEMIYSVIIPQFEKERTTEHVIRLVGQDLDQYVDMVKNDLVFKEVIRQITEMGVWPSNADKDVIELAVTNSIKQHKEKLMTIPKGYYKDIKYDVDIDITGESVDTRVRYATLFAILQAITADPTMTTDPVKRKILFGMAEEGGINPNDFFGVEKKDPSMMVPEGRAGGGVSAPALGASIPGQAKQTV